MTQTNDRKKAPAISLPEGEPAPLGRGSHLILIDGSGYIFRAFHALPPLTRPSDGLPVGAVHGFAQMLWKFVAENKGDRAPTHMAVIFDAGRETFRNAIYPEYKAQRPPPPEELVPQFPLIREAVTAFNIAAIEQDGFEADDLIATYARDAQKAGAHVTIVSSDKDLMQLVGPGIAMLDTMKNKDIGPDEVREKFGVAPDKVVDVQALAGDSVDNVPGVPGIGIKTAAELINEYGDLETLLARAGEIKQPKRREKLIENAEKARLSKQLVILKDDVPLNVTADKLALQETKPTPLLTFLRLMEFNSLTKRIADKLGAEAPPPLARSVGDTLSKSKSTDGDTAPAAGTDTASTGPQAAVLHGATLAKSQPFDVARYETVTTLARLDAWIAEARSIGRVAFDTETTSLDAMRADLVGFSLATAPGKACYVPVGHLGGSGGDDLFGDTGGAKLLDGQIPIRDALERLKVLLEDPATLKIGQNLKYDALVLTQHNIRIAPIDDTMLMSYALDGGRGSHGMDALSER
ncbi:MAG: polymerase, partial [Pseudomonadota bacterium]